MSQLEIDFAPVLGTEYLKYKGYKITAKQKQRKTIIYEEATRHYQQRYNLSHSCFTSSSYWETEIQGHGIICGVSSDCFSLEVAIECTKQYIESFLVKRLATYKQLKESGKLPEKI